MLMSSIHRQTEPLPAWASEPYGDVFWRMRQRQVDRRRERVMKLRPERTVWIEKSQPKET